MEALRSLVAAGASHVMGTFAPTSPYGAPSLLGALLVALGWFAWRRLHRGRALRLRAFLRMMFARRILLHPSSGVDLGLWILNTIVFASGYVLLALGAFFWRDHAIAALTGLLGSHRPLGVAPGLALLVSTLAELLAYEFAYWGAHYAFHRIPALWEFHKVHHSAEVMTALTEMRQHPIEIIFFMNAISLATGLVFGLMTYVFGPGTGHITLLNGNIVLTLFMLTWGHLRHSHLWIPVQGLFGKLFQSPAHHQIHHSLDSRHYDKNLGFALAVWDWAFGTLHIPSREPEVTRFGVGEEYEDYATVARSLARPFAKASEALRQGPAPLAGDVRAP
jgi:sterol desaturase/sphingolipid hydroxylase (fatty acid hydroxylase superfamily)